MMIRPCRLVLTVEFSMIVAIASASLAFPGCGGDNPSQFAGTIEPEPKRSKSPDAKSPDTKSSTKDKANSRDSNP